MLYVQVHLTLPAWVHDEVDTAARYETDEQRMALAIQLARRNVELDTGGPFGAAVFDGAGRLIAAGVNRVVQHNCSVAHAEMMAFMTPSSRTGWLPRRRPATLPGGHPRSRDVRNRTRTVRKSRRAKR